MAADPFEILRELKNKQYRPLYFLQGEEPFFIDQISDFVEENVLNESEKGFNQTILYGKETSMGDLLNHARRFPMMAERQVVILKEAQEMTDLRSESTLKLLEDYLNNPVPSTVLVICHKHKSLDRRKSITKKIESQALSLIHI